MAKYRKVEITEAGVILARQALSGAKKIVFTKVESGSGEYGLTESLKTRQGLKAREQSFAVSGVTKSSQTGLIVRAVISNVNQDGSTVAQGYYMREIGLYAKPENGTEVLYAIAVAEQGKEEFVPEYASGPPFSNTIDFILALGNAESVKIQYEMSAYATARDLSELSEKVEANRIQAADNKTRAQRAEDKADASARQWVIDVPADGWSGSFPYKRTVAVQGMKAEYAPCFGILNDSVDEAGAKRLRKIALKRVRTMNGSVEIECMKQPGMAFKLLGKGV